MALTVQIVQTVPKKISIKRFDALSGASAGLSQKMTCDSLRRDGDDQDLRASF